jgi:hypothetical protein
MYLVEHLHPINQHVIWLLLFYVLN